MKEGGYRLYLHWVTAISLWSFNRPPWVACVSVCACLCLYTYHLFRLLCLVLDVFDFAKELLDGNLGLFQSLPKIKMATWNKQRRHISVCFTRTTDHVHIVCIPGNDHHKSVVWTDLKIWIQGTLKPGLYLWRVCEGLQEQGAICTFCL